MLRESSTTKSYDFMTISFCPDYDLTTTATPQGGGGTPCKRRPRVLEGSSQQQQQQATTDHRASSRGSSQATRRSGESCTIYMQIVRFRIRFWGHPKIVDDLSRNRTKSYDFMTISYRNRKISYDLGRFRIEIIRFHDDFVTKSYDFV